MSKTSLKLSELFFKLPLQLCLLTALHELAAAVRCQLHDRDVLCARGDGNESVSVAPKTPARDECILKTIAGHHFELEVPEPLIFGGFQKLSRDFRTRDSLVISGQRNGHAILQVS